MHIFVVTPMRSPQTAEPSVTPLVELAKACRSAHAGPTPPGRKRQVRVLSLVAPNHTLLPAKDRLRFNLFVPNHERPPSVARPGERVHEPTRLRVVFFLRVKLGSKSSSPPQLASLETMEERPHHLHHRFSQVSSLLSSSSTFRAHRRTSKTSARPARQSSCPRARSSSPSLTCGRGK
jgi:hypothetical protein